jgi:hypothetical protein
MLCVLQTAFPMCPRPSAGTVGEKIKCETNMFEIDIDRKPADLRACSFDYPSDFWCACVMASSPAGWSRDSWYVA